MAASTHQALTGLRLATQALSFAGIRTMTCIRSPFLCHLGALNRLIGNSQQQLMPIAPLAGHDAVRALRTGNQRDDSGSSEPIKAPLPGAVGAVKAAGAALKTVLRGLQLLATPYDRKAFGVFERNKDSVAGIIASHGAPPQPSSQPSRQPSPQPSPQPSGNPASAIASGPGPQEPKFRHTETGTGTTTGPNIDGTGFVLRHRGRTLLLTSYHVVKAAGWRWVQFQFSSGDDETLVGDALVAAGDMDLDVAVLLPTAETLETLRNVRPLTLGSSAGLREGQQVFALGSPSFMDKGFSAGAISDVHKGTVQTDAMTIPGYSGGPLLDIAGHVVGVQKSKGFLAVAAPIDQVKELLDQFIPDGVKAIKAMDMTVVLDGDRPGVVVSTVNPYSTAAQAGLKPTTRGCPGDRIIGIDGRPVRSYTDLVHALSGKRAGDTVELDILRSRKAPAGGRGSGSGGSGQQQPQRLTVLMTVERDVAGNEPGAKSA